MSCAANGLLSDATVGSSAGGATLEFEDRMRCMLSTEKTASGSTVSLNTPRSVLAWRRSALAARNRFTSEASAARISAWEQTKS